MTEPTPQQPPSTNPSTTTTPDIPPLDLGITLALHAWPALNLAVTSNWGGPTSNDKRDWLCGAISDMLSERPETDAEDLEDVLVQVMSDEFDVVVDDESAGEVAREIMEIRGLVERGGEAGRERVREMWEGYVARKGKGTAGIRRAEGEEEGDSSSSEEEGEGENGQDVEMDEAPGLVRASERVEPEVDDDGFTKVVGKKKR